MERKRIFIVVVLLLFWGSLYLPVFAAGTPAIFSYQGRLTDSSDNLLSGTYYFKFSIWDNSSISSGTKLWPTSDPTSLSLTTTEGVFNVNIGDAANGYPDVLDYNFNTDEDIYLQVEVSSSGDAGSFETLSPRQRISSAVFARLSAAVSGTGQSSFGTTTPFSSAVVSIESTATSFIPALIRGFAGQIASLFRIEDSSSNHLFSINSLGGIFASSTLAIGTSEAGSFFVNSSGKVGVGTTLPSRKFNIFEAASSPQLRLGQTDSVYGEIYGDSSGDVQVSSTGGNIRGNNENLWVCKDGACAVETPAEKGNVIVETSVIFDNNFRFKQTNASTTVMYDTTDTAILEFDEGQ